LREGKERGRREGEEERESRVEEGDVKRVLDG